MGQTPGQPLLDQQYTLDAAGRVAGLAMTAPLDPASVLTSSTSTHTYDAASQVSTSGYTYDARGRLYAWDGASRLTGVATATLAYNGFGDLRTRTQGGTTVRYHYNRAIGLSPMVAEQDGSSGQLLRYYVWTPGGRLLYMIDAAGGNKPYFYHFDRTGSTLALTDGTGQVSDAYAYDPYGRLLGRTGSSVQPFTFVGQWGVRQEGSSGTLYHMRARYYDAATGRFLSRDPVWPQLGDARQINPYLYVTGDPLGQVDPTGTQGLLDPRSISYSNLAVWEGGYRISELPGGWELWYVGNGECWVYHVSGEEHPYPCPEDAKAKKPKPTPVDTGKRETPGKVREKVQNASGGVPNPLLDDLWELEAANRAWQQQGGPPPRVGLTESELAGLPPPVLFNELWEFSNEAWWQQRQEAQGVLDPRSIIYSNMMYD